jgi:hypothetical protein
VIGVIHAVNRPDRRRTEAMRVVLRATSTDNSIGETIRATAMNLPLWHAGHQVMRASGNGERGT